MHARTTTEMVFEKNIGHQLADTSCRPFRGESRRRRDLQFFTNGEVDMTDYK